MKKILCDWKVVDLYRLAEPGSTVAKSTLAGTFSGYSESQARVRAERRYGELPYAKFSVIKLEHWKEVAARRSLSRIQTILF